MRLLSCHHCRICGGTKNPIVASERPCALWNDKPWMPEGHYTLVRCSTCGNLYVDSDVTKEYLERLQAESVPKLEGTLTYESTAAMEDVRNSELQQNWEIIKKIRSPSVGDKLLDFGSAYGAFGNIAKKDGVKPNGVELQAQAVCASIKLWGEGVVHSGPIENAPFAEGEFQYGTSFETLEHLYDPVEVLKQIGALLSKDGVIAISVPSADYFLFKYWIYRKQPFSGWMRKNMPGNMQEGRVLVHNHINTFSVNSVTLMIEKAGLKVKYISPIGWRGGYIGKVGRLIAYLLWLFSHKRIAFAPSIFFVANKSENHTLKEPKRMSGMNYNKKRDWPGTFEERRSRNGNQ